MRKGLIRVHTGTDHAGFELKEQLVKHLEEKGYEIEGHDAHEYDTLDDYPPFHPETAEAVIAEPGPLGVVIGGPGNDEQMATNRVKGVHVILVRNDSTARLACERNSTNVVSTNTRQHSVEKCFTLVDAFLETPFSQDERHQRRISLMDGYEGTHRK